MTGIERPDVIGATRRAETIRNGMISYAAAMEAIGEAFDARDWVALGYKNWDEYCEKEFSEKRLKLNQEQRERAILAFRDSGMSVRAIGSALGVGVGTVHRTLNPGVPNGTPGDPTDTQPGREEGGNQAGPETATGAHASPTDSLAGQPQVPDVPEVSPLVANDQPETSHPSATGEAPAEVGEALPGAGQDPTVDVPPSSTVDEPGGGLAGPPSGDPEAITAAFEWVAEFIEGIDADVAGPLLSTSQLTRIAAAVDLIVHTAELLSRWQQATT